MPKATLRLSDFDYRLPKELIAQYPCKKRDHSRLLVLDRAKQKISHHHFSDILDYLQPQDALVLNNTKVIPARIIGRRESFPGKGGGGRQELFFLEHLAEGVERVLARPANKLTVGVKVLFDHTDIFASVLADEGRTKLIRFSGNGEAREIWGRLGQVPLPPYIKRTPEELDKERYQTVYARQEGASASPTAGLHFTSDLLQAVKERRVNVAALTLHVNYGTFAPVKCEDIRQHRMHKEYFIFPKQTQEIICSTRAAGKKVLAVGTTSLRVLESRAANCQEERPALKDQTGWTDLFIYPPYQFKIVDRLLTNFHFPKSTLLMLVSAFAGRDLLFRAYQEAMEKKYRFFSYGDAMLII